MSMGSLRRWTSRALLLSAAALGSALPAPSASAAVVSYDGRCARSADVVQWSPKNGAVARFVADTFASITGTGLWIGLGRSKTAFWSAEGGEPNDACDDCRTLHLVETRFDGTRTRHAVLDQADLTRIGTDAAARKAHVLATLWKLAAKTWPAAQLTQDYTLAAGKPPAGNTGGSPAFIAEVAVKGQPTLRWDLTAKPFMCWCEYGWKVKRVSAP